jgi:thiol-disulfide isomerase/thioredoxin
MVGMISSVFAFLVNAGFAACLGDLNCDGVVDGTDLSTFADDFGTTDCGSCEGVMSLISELENRIKDLEDLLENVVLIDDGTTKTIRFTGVNVQIVNGNGSTESLNHHGNLIIGYNESKGSGDYRNGSHNLVIGNRNNYWSYGGIVSGKDNEIVGKYCSVSGGQYNKADQDFSSVSGGINNTAGAEYSSISGGAENTIGCCLAPTPAAPLRF